MNMAEVIIRVSPDGKATVEAEGVQGSVCTLHTQPFLNALGGKVLEDRPKAEMFEQPVILQQEINS
jgi:hypothetical protein